MEGRRIVKKISAEFEFGVIAPGRAPPKCGVGLRCWENQWRLSSIEHASTEGMVQLWLKIVQTKCVAIKAYPTTARVWGE